MFLFTSWFFFLTSGLSFRKRLKVIVHSLGTYARLLYLYAENGDIFIEMIHKVLAFGYLLILFHLNLVDT